MNAKQRKSQKVIGILGGMGPEATARLFNLVVRATHAHRDQDHIPIIVWSDPRVPDRTAAILGKGVSPVPQLRAGAEILRKAGADVIIITCITAHSYYDEIKAGQKLIVINILEETLNHITRNLPRLKKIGVLATTGTIQAAIIDRTFAGTGVEVIIPTAEDQKKVMVAIYGKHGIKAGFPPGPPRKILAGVARRLVRRGAEIILAGCTEVPLVLESRDLPVPLIDPMAVGAEACIRLAGHVPKTKIVRRKS